MRVRQFRPHMYHPRASQKTKLTHEKQQRDTLPARKTQGKEKQVQKN